MITRRGVTTLEVIMVIGLSVIIGGCALFISMDTYRSSSFRDDRALLISVLQRARAQSMSNTCLGVCTDGRPHGVHLQSDAYVIFQGNVFDPFDPLNQRFRANHAVIHSGTAPDEIIFDQLSGATDDVGTILLSGQGKTSTITIGSEGQISWTN